MPSGWDEHVLHGGAKLPMKRLLLVVVALCGLAHAASFPITAVRIDGTGTPTRTGTATVAAGTLTSSAGATFAAGDVGSGIIFNSIVCRISAFTNATTVTVTAPCANATAQAYTVLTSACYNAGSCNGWVAEFDLSATVAAGGTYSLGFTQGTNFVPTSAKIVFSCTSSGFTNAGGATTYVRTIYGTRQLRQANPNFGTNDEVNATVMTLRVALSDVVYSGDTCTVGVGAGIYTDGSANTNSALAGGTAVTNNSTLTYATSRVIANWSRVANWQKYSGATIPLAAVAFQRHATNGLPVACVVFTVSDAHAHSNSVTVAVPTIDPTQRDGPTYSVTGSVTSGTFTAGEQLKQTSTGALSFAVIKPTGSVPMIMTTPLGPTDNTHTWVGQSSAAIYTPSSIPIANAGLTNVIEYVANVPTTGFTQGDKLSMNFKAYPWIGDSSTAMDTSDGVNSEPTPLYTTKFGIWDGSSTYGTAAAVVDPSQTIAGSLTSGTLIVGEKVTQSTSAAVAYTNNAPTGSTSLIIGATVSGTPNSTNGSTWTGTSSGAVFTQTGGPVAVGSDANSCAVAEATYVQGTTPGGACATINGAAVKMAAFNNATYTRNDVAGTMYLKQGGYNWLGSATATPNTTANVWATLTPFQGVTQAQVVIQTQNGSDNQSFGTQCTSGSTNCGTPIHLKGITVNVPTNPVAIFKNITYLWFDNCVVSMTATAPIYLVTDVYITQGAFPTVSTPGLYPFGGANMSMALIRGADLTGGLGQIFTYTDIGDINLSVSNQIYFFNEASGQTNPVSNGLIFAFNGMWRTQPVAQATIGFNASTGSLLGNAIVQNVFENNNANETLATLTNAADSSTGTNVNNVLLWDNVLVGGRMNASYDDSGDTPLIKTDWASVGNLMDQDAIKTDTFNGTPSGARIGNWEPLYGVGRRFSMTQEPGQGTWAASPNFRFEFPGLTVYEGPWAGTNANGTSTGNPIAGTAVSNTNYFNYNNRSAFDGTSAGTGYGDYRLLTSSRANSLVTAGQQVLPYDFAGIPRDNRGLGAIGAYEQTILPQVFLTF